MFMLENVTESPSENAADNPQHSAAGEGCILLVTYYIYMYIYIYIYIYHIYIYIYVNREREREIDRCKQYIYIYIITCIITTSA